MKVSAINHPFFAAYPVNEHIVRIFGVGQEVMTLVEGREKALLFDTGLGYGNIREFVESMTDKPVTVVISHGHGDHIGGNSNFDAVYIHPKDMDLVKDYMNKDAKDGVAPLCIQRGYEPVDDYSPMIERKPVKLIPAVAGDVFQLGGIDLEVIEMPGHTSGSIALYDEVGRYILTGDAICRGTLLGLPGAPGMEEFRDMLAAFIEKYRGKIDYVLEAHGPCPDQFRIFEGNFDAVDGFLKGKYSGYADDFGTIMGMPIWRVKPETGIEGFCTDGMLGNVTFIKEEERA